LGRFPATTAKRNERGVYSNLPVKKSRHGGNKVLAPAELPSGRHIGVVTPGGKRRTVKKATKRTASVGEQGRGGSFNGCITADNWGREVVNSTKSSRRNLWAHGKGWAEFQPFNALGKKGGFPFKRWRKTPRSVKLVEEVIKGEPSDHLKTQGRREDSTYQ